MSDNNIDQLDIEITATTKSAEDGIIKLQNTIQHLRDLVKSINNLKPISEKKITNIQNSIEAFSKGALHKFASNPFAIFESKNIVGQTAVLSDLATAVTRLTAAGGRTRLTHLIDKLAELNLHNFENLGRTAEYINQLAASLERLAAASEGIKALQRISKASPEAVAKAIEKVQKSAKAVEAGKEALRQQAEAAATAIPSWIPTMMAGLSQAQTVMETVVPRMIQPLKELGQVVTKVLYTGIKNLIMPVLTGFVGKLQTAISRVTELASSFGRIMVYRLIRHMLTEMSDALYTGMKNMYEFSRVTGGIFKSTMDNLSSSMLYFKNSIGAAVAPLMNMLVPAIEVVIDKIVTLLNFINQLFALLSGASTWTKAIKVQTEYAEATSASAKAMKDFTMGFDELNVISQNSGGGGGAKTPDYASMFENVALELDPDSWLGQLKAKIDAGDWEGIGNLLAEKFNSLFDNFNAELAGSKLGQNIQHAIDIAHGFLSQADFDNVGTKISGFLNGAISEINGQTLGEVLAGKWNAIIGVLRGAIANFKFDEFGQMLGTTLYSYIATIDWSGLFGVFSGIANGVGTTLYNAFAGHDWAALGVQIATAFNNTDWSTAIDTLVIGFKTFVIGVMDIVMGFVSTLDWGIVFYALASGIVGFAQTITETFMRYDWTSLGAAIATGFNTINWEYVGGMVGLGLKTFIDSILNLLVGFCLQADWIQIMYAVATAVGSLNWLSIVGKLLVIAGNVIAALILGIVGLLVGLAHSIIVEIERAIALIVDTLSGLVSGIINVVIGLISSIVGAISGLFSWLFGEQETYDTTSETNLTNSVETKKGILSGFVDAIVGFFNGLFTNVTTIIGNLWTNITTSTTNTWNSIVLFLNTIWTNLTIAISSFVSGIETAVNNVWTAILNTSTTIWNNITTAISTALNTAKTNVSTIWNSIKTNIGTIIGEIKVSVKTKFDNMKDDVVTSVKNIKEKVLEFWNNIKTGISDIITKIKEIIDGFVNKLKDVYNKIVDFIEDIKEAAGKAVQAVKDFMSGGKGGGSSTKETGSAVAVRYATGGFPEAGELFIAREAGAEMVGRIGSRTAVANNDQIVQGIYEGVLAAMNDSGGNGTIGVNVYLDGKQITTAIEKYQKQRGAMIYAGGVVNGV